MRMCIFIRGFGLIVFLGRNLAALRGCILKILPGSVRGLVQGVV